MGQTAPLARGDVQARHQASGSWQGEAWPTVRLERKLRRVSRVVGRFEASLAPSEASGGRGPAEAGRPAYSLWVQGAAQEESNDGEAGTTP